MIEEKQMWREVEEMGSQEEKMSDGPKLYVNKPKRGQLKPKGKDYSSPSTNPSLSPPPPPSGGPPTPPKESFARRYKFVWPLLLTVNLAIGVYLFLRTNTKKEGTEDGDVPEEIPTAASSTAVVPEKPAPVPPPIKVRPPIPEDEQRQLFKWLLEEKRKLKPANPAEKKRIDEEKAILKQYIRAKSIPNI